ncbi:MAG: quercetin dioxygenase-like cupin family protein [Polyangiales bacterium]
MVCTAGEITIVQEVQGKEKRVTLSPGDYAINEAGVWHTGDVNESATAIFITTGSGTEHRAR